MFDFLQSFAHWPCLLVHFYSSTSAEKQPGRITGVNAENTTDTLKGFWYTCQNSANWKQRNVNSNGL